jgi:hypothetical protein
MKKLEECFIAFWCIVMPITNFVVLPMIPGTIPAFLIAPVSLGFIAARMITGTDAWRVSGYLKILVIAALLWTVLLTGSQLGHLLDNRHNFSGVPLVAPDNPAVLFRIELFTQSTYLLACILIALYLRFFFQPHMMRYVYWGAYLMALYGIYEWLFFLVFKEPGDFLGNRVYGLGTAATHTGSWSQPISFAGIQLLRIKSTFGEPSFFAAAVVPYFFLALDTRKYLLTALVFFTAFFSTSTSCYLSLAACFIIRSFWVGKGIGQNVGIALLFAFGLFAMAQLYPDTFNSLFVDKFSGQTASGNTHLEGLTSLEDLLETFSPFNWIFGVGLGYIYESVTMAVFFNTGLIGLALFIYMFWKPILGLHGGDGVSLGLKSAALGIFIAYTLNVAEFYLPTTWMFIGLAYWKLAQEHASAGPAREGGVVS